MLASCQETACDLRIIMCCALCGSHQVLGRSKSMRVRDKSSCPDCKSVILFCTVPRLRARPASVAVFMFIKANANKKTKSLGRVLGRSTS